MGICKKFSGGGVVLFNSVDCIITDPPYGLTSITRRLARDNASPIKYQRDGAFARLSKGFMGQRWDGQGVEYDPKTWQACFEVLKPGGFLLSFGGSRTFHRIACAIEDAGLEIRDTIMWLYATGFPKCLNVGLRLDKRNGVESEVVGVKEQSGPKFKLTQKIIDNGGLNRTDRTSFEIRQPSNEYAGWYSGLKPAFEPIIVARKPFSGSLVDNIVEYGVGAFNIDDCRIPNAETWNRKEAVYEGVHKGYKRGKMFVHKTEGHANEKGRYPTNVILTYDDDSFYDNFYNLGKNGSARRFFYSAKASVEDRNEGMTDGKNEHPTLKPTALMQYLIRLVAPKGAVILDPFMGSGSTGKRAMRENAERGRDYKFIGIDLDEKFCRTAKQRIDYATILTQVYHIISYEDINGTKISDKWQIAGPQRVHEGEQS